MNKDDFLVKTQVKLDITRVATLLNTGVFNASVLSVFRESVFTEIMIKLNDILQKLDKYGSRINFTDDVETGDITDLVNKVRNAVCHMHSGEHLLDKERKIKFTFNVAYGKGKIANINGKTLTSDYKDDICFFFGEHKIYLKRHIIRALSEAEARLKIIYSENETK